MSGTISPTTTQRAERPISRLPGVGGGIRPSARSRHAHLARSESSTKYQARGADIIAGSRDAERQGRRGRDGGDLNGNDRSSAQATIMAQSRSANQEQSAGILCALIPTARGVFCGKSRASKLGSETYTTYARPTAARDGMASGPRPAPQCASRPCRVCRKSGGELSQFLSARREGHLRDTRPSCGVS